MRSVPFLALLVAGSLVGPPAPPTTGRWVWPVGDGARPAVLAPFDAPERPWGPGHRGIDLAARPGGEVVAVAPGVITHRGRVAGRGTITVRHPDGVHSTYEPVDSTRSVGERVRRGTRIGRVGDEAGHCFPAGCLHLGARRGSTYLDPMTFFGVRRVVLLPVG